MASTVRRHPRLAATLLLWAVGLSLAFLWRPPAITPEQTAAFRLKIKQAEGVLSQLTSAEQRLMDAELDQRRYKVWFWRFKPAARAQVEARQPAVDAARLAVAEVEARRDALLREAKAALGLWSEAGVEEARELFADSFAAGKLFAQRQSFWDALFTILNSRDRDWLSLLLQLLIQTIINFVTGVSVSGVVFLFRLPSLIWSYLPGLWSALAFFALAGLAGISVVVTYVGLLVGAGAGATYGAVWMLAAQQQRLEGRAAAQRRIDYGREHAE